jgi:hypothetical protein
MAAVVIGGVDTHADVHLASACDQLGAVRGTRSRRAKQAALIGPPISCGRPSPAGQVRIFRGWEDTSPVRTRLVVVAVLSGATVAVSAVVIGTAHHARNLEPHSTSAGGSAAMPRVLGRNVQVAVDTLRTDGWQVEATDVSAYVNVAPPLTVIAERFAAHDHPRGVALLISAGPHPKVGDVVIGSTCQYGPPAIGVTTDEAFSDCVGGPVTIPITVGGGRQSIRYTDNRPPLRPGVRPDPPRTIGTSRVAETRCAESGWCAVPCFKCGVLRVDPSACIA